MSVWGPGESTDLDSDGNADLRISLLRSGDHSIPPGLEPPSQGEEVGRSPLSFVTDLQSSDSAPPHVPPNLPCTHPVGLPVSISGVRKRHRRPDSYPSQTCRCTAGTVPADLLPLCGNKVSFLQKSCFSPRLPPPNL